MATASITSTVNGVGKTDLSRDDLTLLTPTNVVATTSVNVGTAYQWSIAFRPEDSAAVFLSTGTESAINRSPGTFTVDKDGPYLIRLVYTTPQITLNTVLAAGVTFTLNGVLLTAVAGGRTPGNNDFSVHSGTIAGITADMVDAINDVANSFVAANLAGTDASPAVVIAPITETAPAGGTVTILYSGTASDVTIADYATEQYVRLRALTAFGDLKLVAAGERYDTLKVPIDATFDGWADEQNFNLQALLGFAKTSAASGRVIYVDPETGDFTTIQAAIDHAVAQTPPPSPSKPWVVLVRPGVYQEDVAFAPYVHVFGWPGGTGTGIVEIQCATNAGHTLDSGGGGDSVVLADLTLKQPPAALPVITQSGSGGLTIYRCSVVGQCSITGSGTLTVIEGGINGNGAVPLDYAVQVGGSCSLKAERCVFAGQSIILADDLSQVTLDDCEIQASGTYAINTWAESTVVLFTTVTSGLIGVNEGGAGTTGNLSFEAHFSHLQNVSIDDDNIVVADFQLGATAHGTITEHNTAVMQAGVPADTIFYDNVLAAHPIPLAAADVQAALDEIYTYAAAVRTLDDAYRSTGTARTIVADIGAVQIVDAAAPSDPIPPDNTNGNLNVVGAVKLGALNKPEINLDPNPFDNGPVIRLGHEVWANDAPYGGNAWIMGNATGLPQDHNYNLILGTLPAEQGTNTGRVILMGGNAISDVDAGSVFIQGGTGQDGAGGVAGDIFLVPGESAASAAGQVLLVDQSTGTGATLTAGAGFVNPMVAGDITFGTNSGPLVVTFAGGENLVATQALFDATGVVTAAFDPIVLTTVAKGPTAEIYFLAESVAGVDTQLGGFSAGAKVAGTWPSQIGIVVSDANEISFGPTGAVGPMIYNADTGKLTVPGIIDPTGMIFDEAGTPATVGAEGAIFVSDGSTGVQNHLYYVDQSGSLTDLTAGGGGGGTLQDAYDAGNSIVTSGATHIDFTLSTAGGGFLVDGAVADEGFAGFGSATRLLAFTVEAQAMALNSTQGASFIGGANTDFRMNADAAAPRTLLVSATNVDVGGTADLTIDAEDQITVGGTNTLAPIIKVAGGANAEILNLSQTTGESFGLFAGTADPNGSVSASAGSLFVRDTGAGASIYQNRSTGTGTVWTELSGTGDVVGPAGATNNALARFDLGTGKLLQGSVGLLTDLGDLSGLTKVTTTDLAVATLTVPVVGQVLQAADVAGNVGWVDRVSGPGSSTDEAIARFDAATGNLLKNSTATLTDVGLLTATDVTATAGLVGATLQVTTGAVLNHVLTSNGSGNATWAAPPGASGTHSSAFAWVGAATTTTTTITGLNVGDIVLQIWIRYTTTFQDATSTVECLESGGGTSIVAPAMTLPTSNQTGAWVFDPVYIAAAAPHDLQVRVISGAVETQGEGVVIALIHRA